MNRVFWLLLGLWIEGFSLLGYADQGPWFTGPLLAPAGHTVPKGHSNLEVYGFNVDNNGLYNRHWKLIHTPAQHSVQGVPVFSHGISDFLDIQGNFPYSWNSFHGRSSAHMSDSSVILGFQILEQKDSLWIPNLRLAVQEIVPLGKFKNLDDLGNGTDGSGLGSYQTGVYLNFQLLSHLWDVHYLSTRLSLGYTYAAPVNIEGTSSFGGGKGAYGQMKPGSLINFDLAGELSLTQNWVVVMETYIAERQATNFIGFPGLNKNGTLAMIGNEQVVEITLAPALEFNFNAHVGIIVGPWFSVRGKDTSSFEAVIAALNLYW